MSEGLFPAWDVSVWVCKYMPILAGLLWLDYMRRVFLSWMAGLEGNLPAGVHGCCQGDRKMPSLQANQQQHHWKVYCDLGQGNIARMSVGTFFLALHLSTWRACNKTMALASSHSFLLFMGEKSAPSWWVWSLTACLQGADILVCPEPGLGSLPLWQPTVSSIPVPGG